MTIDAPRVANPASPGTDPTDHASTSVEDAARQFEALLLASMLKSMREAGSGGWLGGGEDAASTSAMELAVEQFARALAAQGGLGLAALVADGLKHTR